MNADFSHTCEGCEHVVTEPWAKDIISYLQMKASPYPDGDENVLACQNCKSGEYLYNEDGNRNSFCGQCGKAIDWGEEADK